MNPERYLEIKSCASQSLPLNLGKTAEELVTSCKNNGLTDATIVIWQINKIIWGAIESDTITLIGGEGLRPELWQELRVFNETAEIHLVSKSSRLIGRLRSDLAGEATDYVDTMSRFWGKIEKITGTILLADKNRKLSMELPLPRQEEKPLREYLGLVTRNYISCNETTAQAGYTDYRYVKTASADR